MADEEMPGSFKDRDGRTWISGEWLAKTIRETGTTCHMGGGAISIQNRFSDELLQQWETVETSPEEGHKPGDSNHG